jgi:hypothetical protein
VQIAAMTTGSLTLSEHPGATVQIVCEKCGRQGQYRKATLIDKCGGDVAPPDLLRLVAADCPKKATHGSDLCGVHYVGL